MKPAVELFVGQLALRKLSACGNGIPCWWDAFGTLLFIRLAGVLAGQLHQTDLDKLQEWYFQLIFEAIDENEGEVCLVIGNDVCGFFDSRDNGHARKAVEAARKIDMRIAANVDRDVHLKSTMGVHTCQLRFGIVGSPHNSLRQIMLGAGVNIGSALAGPRASSDQVPYILISETTAAQMQDGSMLREQSTDVLSNAPACRIFSLK